MQLEEYKPTRTFAHRVPNNLPPRELSDIDKLSLH